MSLVIEAPTEIVSYDQPLVVLIQNSLDVKERIPIDEWAETYYTLPPGSYAAGNPYRFDNTPWMREILQRLDPDDPCTNIVFVKPTQIGATTAGTIWSGYTVHQKPTNFLYVTSTLELARDHMSQRMDKLISSCRVVRECFYEGAKKRGVNTILDKEFIGGRYKAIGTVTPDGLRSMASECEHFDEVDAYEFDSGGEGDPIEGAKDRSETFRYDRKHFYTSTPLQAATSRIWPLFEAGDRRRYFVPCCHCELMQYLKWAQIKWDTGDYTSARYECEGCGRPWTEGQRIRATQAGKWIGERPWNRFIARSYHLTGRMYSHRVDMPSLVQMWYEAQERPEKLVHFVHTVLGEPSNDQSMYAYETDQLYERREAYEYPCPEGVQYITAGIDVQDDRLEMVTVGWGYQEEAWVLGRYILVGPTEQPDVWDDLAEVLNQPYETPTGEKFVFALCIDQRYREHEVAAFCRRRLTGTRFIWPIKGARDDGMDSKQDIWPRRAEVKNRGRKRVIEAKQKTYFSINTFAAKKTIYARCKFAPPGPARWHFPDNLDRDFFEQFTSESLVSNRRGAKVIQHWVVKQGRRNEVLDCMVYALAALRGLYSLNIKLRIPSDAAVSSGGDVSPRSRSRSVESESTNPRGEPAATQPPPSPPRAAPTGRRKWQPRRFVQRRMY